MKLLTETLSLIGNLDEKAMNDAQLRLDSLMKPPGSLGRLEEIAKKLAGITGRIDNSFSKKVIIVMAADNGVVEEGVTSFPSAITAVVTGFMPRGVTGVGVLARLVGAELRIVDIGVAGDLKEPAIIDRKIMPGTHNMTRGPAMSREQAVRAIEAGIEVTDTAIAQGADLIGTGEMGIGNTTTSSAILHVYAEDSLELIVGRGAGLSDEGLMKKREIIRRSVEVNKPLGDDPLDVLSKVGGLDIAGLAGTFLAAASRRIPVIIDGFISGAAALIALKLKPEARNFMFCSHVSAEPGARKLIAMIGLKPMLDMDMRLGEGTGCALAMPLMEGATRIIREMATLADAGC
jgi:nicotinate-nucleotide--dimethylbenzimidazole phosphoribosyltransferase